MAKVVKKESKVRKLVEDKDKKVFLPKKTLDKIIAFKQFMDEASFQLGQLTLEYEQTKANFLNQICHKQIKYNDLMQELDEEYGRINIELSTGEVTPIVEESKNSPPPPVE